MNPQSERLNMCGIAGFRVVNGNWSNQERRLESARSALVHRGPDANGIWLDPKKEVGLAHTRLAILDLNQRSVQPMVSASGTSVLTFNGEIYNYLDLRRDFATQSWKTTSDTEVALAAIERDGARAFSTFDGMFALAHYNLENRELLLAVDPFGKKPIYTYWDGSIFAFASEIKALAAMGLPLEICPEAMSEYFALGAVLDSGTVYKNIRRLLGGHSQVVSNLRPLKPQPYWDLPIGQSTKISYADACVQTEDLIARAVKKRLVADVPIATFLSGGLDSSVIALEAQSAGSDGLRTFSVGFPDQAHFDESRYAEIVAHRIRSHHCKLDGKTLDSPRIYELFRHFDEPFPDSSLMPTAVLCEQVSMQAKVALSGDGGDEIFGGYRRMQAALLTENWSSWMKLALKPVKWSGLQASSHRSRLGFLLRLQSAIDLPTAQRLLKWNSYFSDDSLARHFESRSEQIQAKMNKLEARVQGQDTGQKILYINAKTYLFSDLLPKVDRMSMLFGLEVRSPFLDKQLAEFVFTLPTKYKFSPLKSKVILKDIYRKRLGSEIVDRKKQGFATPLGPVIKQWKESATGVFPPASVAGCKDWASLLNYESAGSNFEACAFAMWSALANSVQRANL